MIDWIVDHNGVQYRLLLTKEGAQISDWTNYGISGKRLLKIMIGIEGDNKVVGNIKISDVLRDMIVKIQNLDSESAEFGKLSEKIDILALAAIKSVFPEI